MYKRIAALLLLVIIGRIASSQSGFSPESPLKVDKNAVTVIANGGLRLRQQPGTGSKILTVIPFGARIEYLSDQSFGQDSVAFKGEEGRLFQVFGCWVKVRYGQMEGYVLDIYLFWHDDHKRSFADDINKDYILLYPGCGCDPHNLYDPAKWKLYGYFENTGGELSVKPVDIRYVHDRPVVCELFISASEMKGLKFIIGVKNAVWPQKNTKAYATVSIVSADDNTPDVNELAKDSLFFDLHGDTNKYHGYLYLAKAAGMQFMGGGEIFDFPAAVHFVGDLDGDGADDYIIFFGDKGGIIALYLTGNAQHGELIHLSAIFYAGYCC